MSDPRPMRSDPRRTRPDTTLAAISLSALVLSALVVSLGACGSDGPSGAEEAESSDTLAGVATALGTGDAELPPEEIERGRHDSTWRRFTNARARGTSGSGSEGSGSESVQEGRPGGTGASADTTHPESWDDISARAVNRERTHLPLHGDIAGPSVLAVQILLDRALYRPGIIDGRWGKNTEKAVYWMEESEGLEADGVVDGPTFERLRELAGDPQRLVVERELTAADVEGPFVDLPEDVYDRAELDCLCYESRREQLAERFHTSPELLEQLNPDLDLDVVERGDRLQVPNVRPFAADSADRSPPEGRDPQEPIAELVISDGGHYVQALDAEGNLLYHFPSTLGSEYAPSPTDDYEIDSVHQDPTWHYQPELLTGVDPSRRDAVLPSGPNNAVGVVWIQLSRPHYGIHGTSAPATIGYATSHGCIRLTNWDAEFLSHRVEPGIPVRFVDGNRRSPGEEG